MDLRRKMPSWQREREKAHRTQLAEIRARFFPRRRGTAKEMRRAKFLWEQGRLREFVDYVQTRRINVNKVI
jgi:hypothetical protein